MVAQGFVRQYPLRTDKVILGDTSLPDRERGKRWASQRRLLPLIPIWLVRILAKRSLPQMVSVIPDDVRHLWLAYLTELLDRIYSREWLAASYQSGIDYMLNYTFHREDLAGWPGKVLILESDDDTTIGLEQLGLVKAMYPQAQSHTFHNAGHIPAITCEDEYIQVLRDFLKS